LKSIVNTPTKALDMSTRSVPNLAHANSSPAPNHLVSQAAANDEIPGAKPVIQHAPGNVKQALKDAAAALGKTGRFFQNGGQIVTVQRRGQDDVLVSAVSRHALYCELDDAAEWQRLDKRSGEWVRCEPPSKYCKILSESGEYPDLPILRGIANQPCLRADGTVAGQAGYDGESGFYGVYDATAFIVPDTPSMEDAHTALESLKELISEFPFADENSRSAAISAMLTAAMRITLPGAPMFHVRAPLAGSGKSYLCELISAFATGKRTAPVAFPSGSEEFTKLLIAELLRSPAVIEFDNLTSDLLPHKSLCTALTSETVSGRVLGRTKIVSPSTRVLFLSSGNGVGPIADMARRCVTIDLNPGMEAPSARSFTRPDVVNMVRSKRAHYVSAALTIIRAWIAAGSPQSEAKPMGSFGAWSSWCRQPLLWLEQPDPAASVFRGLETDPDHENLKRVLKLAKSRFGTKPFMTRDLIHTTETRQGADLFEVLQEIAGNDSGTINKKRLGQWLRRQLGRVAGGLKIVQAPITRNVQSYQIESVSSVQSVSVAQNENDVEGLERSRADQQPDDPENITEFVEPG